jgi:hypothetical protein
MELIEFKQMHADTAVAIGQSYVAALITSEMLADFPSQLPETMLARMLTGMQQLTEMMRTIIETAPEIHTNRVIISFPLVGNSLDLIWHH